MPSTRRRRRNEANKKKLQAVAHGLDALDSAKKASAKTGGPAEAKSDKQLFVIDKSRDEGVRKKVTYLQRLLAPNPLVAPLFAPPEKKTQTLKKKRGSQANEAAMQVDETEAAAPKKRSRSDAKTAKTTKAPAAKRQRVTRTVDVWTAGEAAKDAPVVPIDEMWVAPQLLEHNSLAPRPATKPRKALPRVNKLPAVPLPHPGTAYIPPPTPHQKLIEEAEKLVHTRLAEENRLDVIAKRMLRRSRAPPFTVSAPLQPSQNADQEGESPGPNPPTSSLDKLTRAQRNKQKRRRKTEDELDKKRDLKKQRVDIDRIRTIVTEIAQEETVNEEELQKRKAKISNKPFTTARLGRLKFEPPVPDVLLPDEIASSLRASRNIGSLMADRYRSLQERNIIPVTLPARHKRKYRLKEYVRGRKITDQELV